MKIAEREWDEDGKIITQETYDPNPLLKDVQLLRHQREAGGPQICDGKHVARLPLWLVEAEARARGIKWDDREAMNEMVRSMVVDRDLRQFRVWDGQPF